MERKLIVRRYSFGRCCSSLSFDGHFVNFCPLELIEFNTREAVLSLFLSSGKFLSLASKLSHVVIFNLIAATIHKTGDHAARPRSLAETVRKPRNTYARIYIYIYIHPKSKVDKMFCIVDRRNKAPLIYKIVVSLRDEVHRVIIRIIATIFFSGKNSNAPIVARSSSNNKTSFHAKYTRNSSTRGYIFPNNIVTIVLFLSIRTRIGQGSGSAMNLAYRRDNPAFLAI